MIESFKGKYFFLSNFYVAPVKYDGLTYNSNEAAFQAQKTKNKADRVMFTAMGPSEAKKMGRQVDLRSDWEDVKDQIMYEICLAKFEQNPDLAKRLFETKNETLVEGNDWGDDYWGRCSLKGLNKLGQILMRVRYDLYFDAEGIKNEVVEWIRDTFEKNGKDCNAIIGISGGKDSSVTAALCVEALGKDRVIGVLMPNGVQPDIDYSKKLVEHLGIRYTEVNIEDAYKGILDNITALYGPNELDYSPIVFSLQTMINLPPRIRMATLYAVSQSMNGRVMNTCNLSEDYVGYSTRYGDSVGDFSPLAMLTSDEVIAIGKACGLPNEFVEKTPSDGLCGKTDEDNLGFTYKVLNRYIRTGVCEDAEIKKRIDDMHEKNLFKLQPMPHFEYKN